MPELSYAEQAEAKIEQRVGEILDMTSDQLVQTAARCMAIAEGNSREYLGPGAQQYFVNKAIAWGSLATCKAIQEQTQADTTQPSES